MSICWYCDKRVKSVDNGNGDDEICIKKLLLKWPNFNVTKQIHFGGANKWFPV